jgi:hypothetical protein
MAEVNTWINLTSIFGLICPQDMGKNFESVLSELAIPAVKMHAVPILTHRSLCHILLEIDRTLSMTKAFICPTIGTVKTAIRH